MNRIGTITYELPCAHSVYRSWTRAGCRFCDTTAPSAVLAPGDFRPAKAVKHLVSHRAGNLRESRGVRAGARDGFTAPRTGPPTSVMAGASLTSVVAGRLPHVRDGRVPSLTSVTARCPPHIRDSTVPPHIRDGRVPLSRA